MGLPLSSQARLVIKSLRLYTFRVSKAWFFSLVPLDEALSPSGESLDSLESLRPSGKIVCSSHDKIISLSSEAF